MLVSNASTSVLKTGIGGNLDRGFESHPTALNHDDRHG
jgi:hypothetical protein